MITPDTEKFRSGPLSVQVESVEQRRTLRLCGELDLATADIVRDALRDALAYGPEEIVIDLSELAFIDSTGIAILISAMADSGEVLKFIPSQAPGVLRVLRLTGVSERMRLLD